MSDGRAFEAFEVFEAALVVGRHWNDQEGVNGARLEELAEAVAGYDAVRVGLPRIEPEAIALCRDALRLWQRRGICPRVAAARHACSWTCGDCKKVLPPTRTSGGEPIAVRCAMLVEIEERWTKGA